MLLDFCLSFSLTASRAVLHLAIWTFAISLLLFNAITSWILYLAHFFWWRLRPPCVSKASWQNLLLHAKGMCEDMWRLYFLAGAKFPIKVQLWWCKSKWWKKRHVHKLTRGVAMSNLWAVRVTHLSKWEGLISWKKDDKRWEAGTVSVQLYTKKGQVCSVVDGQTLYAALAPKLKRAQCGCKFVCQSSVLQNSTIFLTVPSSSRASWSR